MINKVLSIVISICAIIFGLIILVISIFHSGPIQDNKIEHISGDFAKYYEVTHAASRGTQITRYVCLAEGRSYIIDTTTYGAFDKEGFLSNVKAGDLLEMMVENKENNSYVLSIYKDGQEYMNYENTQKLLQKNRTIGLYLGAVIILLGLIGLYAVKKTDWSKYI